MIFGIFPCCAIIFKRSIVSSFPTTSDKVRGRYFSIHGKSEPSPPVFKGADEKDDDEGDEVEEKDEELEEDEEEEEETCVNGSSASIIVVVVVLVK